MTVKMFIVASFYIDSNLFLPYVSIAPCPKSQRMAISSLKECRRGTSISLLFMPIKRDTAVRKMT